MGRARGVCGVDCGAEERWSGAWRARGWALGWGVGWAYLPTYRVDSRACSPTGKTMLRNSSRECTPVFW